MFTWCINLDSIRSRCSIHFYFLERVIGWFWNTIEVQYGFTFLNGWIKCTDHINPQGMLRVYVVDVPRSWADKVVLMEFGYKNNYLVKGNFWVQKK